MDKSKIARSFSRAATTYDSVAYFQREMGEKLLALLTKYSESAPTEASVCIDLGCGTGHFCQALRQQFSGLSYLGLDLAEGMLRYSQAYHQPDYLLCADAESLPLSDASSSVIFSNMALQWCEKNLEKLLAGLYRVLAPGGVLALTTLGPSTLYELKTSWSMVDGLVHVNNFKSTLQWQNAILNQRFNIECHQEKKVVLKYASVNQLLKELKMIGAHNVNDGQRQALTGRNRLAQLLSAYEGFRQVDYYPATYDVCFWVLRKPSNLWLASDN